MLGVRRSGVGQGSLSGRALSDMGDKGGRVLMGDVIDVFCGAGGMSAGLQQSGHRVILGVDHHPSAVKTFRLNHPDAEGRVADLADPASRDDLPDADIVVGGPPCPPYSRMTEAKSRRDDDPRRLCWEYYLQVVRAVEPRWWIMENVPGFQHTEAFQTMSDHCSGTDDRLWSDPRWEWLADYRMTALTLRADDYGVPQKRERIFLVGHRGGRTVAAPVADGQKRTLRQAIGDVPPMTEQPKWPGVFRPVDLHFDITRKIMRDILSHIPPGGNWRSVPDEFGLAEQYGRWKGNHLRGQSQFQRLSWDGQSRTILGHLDGRDINTPFHPDENRILTLYERHIVQGFPDGWLWYGTSRSDVSFQIGNAVCPPVACRLGELLQ